LEPSKRYWSNRTLVDATTVRQAIEYWEPSSRNPVLTTTLKSKFSTKHPSFEKLSRRTSSVSNDRDAPRRTPYRRAKEICPGSDFTPFRACAAFGCRRGRRVPTAGSRPADASPLHEAPAAFAAPWSCEYVPLPAHGRDRVP